MKKRTPKKPAKLTRRTAGPKKKVRLDKPRPQHKEHLAYWEAKFPGKGRALMRILAPFYDWQPKLKPALPGLKGMARQAIFWRKISGVRVFRASDPPPWLSLNDSFRVSLGDSLRAPLWDSLGAQLGDSLRDSLGAQLGDSLRDSLRVSLWASFAASLVRPCGFILLEQPAEARKFQPLLKLWLSGNYPFGFDYNENLLVLDAD